MPEDFAKEAGQASDNVCEALRPAGAKMSDIIQVGPGSPTTTTSTRT
ncbi:hypothetical protein ACFVTC_33740 [Streptomyces sp. NPDC057950]